MTFFEELHKWFRFHYPDGVVELPSLPAAYPETHFATKKAVLEAIKSEIDISFVMPDDTRKKLTDLKDKEILSFVGPTATKVRYAGRVTVSLIGPIRTYHAE